MVGTSGIGNLNESNKQTIYILDIWKCQGHKNIWELWWDKVHSQFLLK